MAHDEKAEGTKRVNYIEMVDLPSETTAPAGVAGRLKMSGSKLYVDNGTDWELVTSA